MAARFVCLALGEDDDLAQCSALFELQERLGGKWEHNKKTLNGYRIRFDLVRDETVLCSGLTDGAGDAAGRYPAHAGGGQGP